MVHYKTLISINLDASTHATLIHPPPLIHPPQLSPPPNHSTPKHVKCTVMHCRDRSSFFRSCCRMSPWTEELIADRIASATDGKGLISDCSSPTHSSSCPSGAFFSLLPQAFLFLFCSLLFLFLPLLLFFFSFNQHSGWIVCTAHDALGTIALVCSEFHVCFVAGFVSLAQRRVRCVSVGRVGGV